MEVHLSQQDDPIAYVLKILRKAALILEVLQTSPKGSIANIYRENTAEIDTRHRDTNVAWNMLRDAVIEVGNSQSEVEDKADWLVARLKESVANAQRTIDLFDSLCDRYALPTSEPLLFAQIGRLIHP